MKKILTALIITAVIVSVIPVRAYASDYQGKEKQDSLFQKLGDFISGKYEVDGKPIKKTGIFQPMADEVKKIEPAPVR